ncbi:hypothetical protein Afil01_47540 [Actinorhabdospora filicis]|uniref:Uncharacterized protein n=1 Tax=Actinorhabdospora filicis TaxID=1785913 RepID=A0A9W6SPW0_9ACTN|nr:hypothetical protein [Actinorhabdospora filicis]GLZ79947.1 hypothetical protein Afil01_47540 [Actinorhabdospora filicis]
MKAEFLRDAAMTAVIFGFVGMGWFGWAQEAPPKRMQKWLGIGSGIGIAIALAGGLIAWRNWDAGTAIDAETGPRFGIIVGIEFGLAGLGAVLLIWRKLGAWIAPWIAFVVGVHFYPLAPLLKEPMLHVTATLVTLGSLLAAWIAWKRKLTPSYVTGVITGSLLGLSGAVALATALLAY